MDIWKSGGTLVVSDVLGSSVQRIATSSITGPLNRLGLLSIFVAKVENSYTSTTQNGEEQFVKVVTRVWPVILCMRLLGLYNYFRNMFRFALRKFLRKYV